MYSSALSIEIISDVEFSRRLVESRSDKLKQVKSRKQLNSAAGTNNSTRQQERNNSTQQEKTTQLVGRNETTQLCTAVDRLQPPTTACNRLQPPATACNRLQPPACNRLHRLYSRIGFFYLLICILLFRF
ncbi:hypothetical protein TNCV_3746421 [Trichonephila clavipes]|nr:hypothetical protein TNCV_3746421 [Trichonephila clavipes]